MRAQLIEQDDIFLGYETQVIKEPWNHPVIGRGAGDISEKNANPRVRFHKLPKGRPGSWGIERGVNGRALISDSFALVGSDDCGPLIGALNGQVAFTIC